MAMSAEDMFFVFEFGSPCMAKPKGRWIGISPFRKMVCDLMHFSQQVPVAIAERQMDLGPLMEARKRSAKRPAWTTIFAKGYGIVCASTPALRRCYLKFPWHRLYEHPHSIVALNVERRLDDEDVVLFCLIRAPENRELGEIEAVVRDHMVKPVEELRSHQRAMAVSRIPWPMRRLFWWCALNLFGRRRCHNYGTFSLTSVGSRGAGLLNVAPILTTAIHYGQIDEKGRVEVRLSWDHRVMDGSTLARALVDLESVLNNQIAEEIRGETIPIGLSKAA